jgi:hypothetical protein
LTGWRSNFWADSNVCFGVKSDDSAMSAFLPPYP